MTPARMAIPFGLLPLALLCACGITNRPQRQWIGQLTPNKDAKDCPSSRGVLVMREGQVNFAPTEGTWVLEGTAGPNTLQATQSRVTSDHKTYATKLDAVWTETAVHGTYTTPLCSYRVDLSRP